MDWPNKPTPRPLEVIAADIRELCAKIRAVEKPHRLTLGRQFLELRRYYKSEKTFDQALARNGFKIDLSRWCMRLVEREELEAAGYGAGEEMPWRPSTFEEVQAGIEYTRQALKDGEIDPEEYQKIMREYHEALENRSRS